MTIATSTEIKNNFGKYLGLVQSGEEVIVTKNGMEVARLISRDKKQVFLSDSLRGILKNDYVEEVMREERLTKHESSY